jgi:hypothetical protein
MVDIIISNVMILNFISMINEFVSLLTSILFIIVVIGSIYGVIIAYRRGDVLMFICMIIITILSCMICMTNLGIINILVV